MVHLRIVVPVADSDSALKLLQATHSATNLIFLEGAARKPEGDVILVDVAKEDASVVIGDLKEMEIPERGSIAIEEIDSHVSEVAKQAEIAARGLPTDAVVWEQVESRTSENTELSGNFLIFMVLSGMLAVVGILLDSPILIIGAMVVGPSSVRLPGSAWRSCSGGGRWRSAR